MVITRQDLLTIVADNAELIKQVYSDYESVLKKCKRDGKLEIFNFYNNCRKNYNQKHSKIYINIMKEVEEPKKVLTTLSALITQILLFAEQSQNRDVFIKQSRLNEILNAVQTYVSTSDLTQGIKLICSLRDDIKFLESL